jgi:hypothetical protein
MGGKKNKKDSPDTRCTWKDTCDATLVATLRQCKLDGLQSDSGWKPVTWTIAAKALEDTPGPPKIASKIQDHWTKSVSYH